MPNTGSLDAQDRALFTQPRRDATTGELLPESETIVDFAVRHGWTHDRPVWDDNAGLWVRLYGPGETNARLDLWFYQATLRTIQSPYKANTAVGSGDTYVCRPIPLYKGIRLRVERFIVNLDCKCEPNSFGPFHDDGPSPECGVHGA